MRGGILRSTIRLDSVVPQLDLYSIGGIIGILFPTHLFMAQLCIRGGKQLSGSLRVLGSKNAALPLLSAALLTDQPVVLRSIPTIADVQSMLRLLSDAGVEIEQRGHMVRLCAHRVSAGHLNRETVGSLRGSILLLGSLLGRLRQVVLPRPGGDIIGARPIDTHLDAFCQLGAVVEVRGDEIFIDGTKVQAGTVTLREFSVTATENILMLAATLSGTTTIHIAACEPHVVALADLLTLMGARIAGAGTSTITVHGKRRLSGAEFANISDMLEAGFFILMAAATGSPLTIEDVPVDHLRLFFKKLDDIGIKYSIGKSSSFPSVSIQPSRLRAFHMQSIPHPGIATDLQPAFAVVATQAHGSSLIHDPLYDDRFKHIIELQKMGAKAYICDPHRVVIEGPTPLHGRAIPSLDIRSGATLVMAGLVAEGETIISGAEIIDRGYENLPQRLARLGADISLEL